MRCYFLIVTIFATVGVFNNVIGSQAQAAGQSKNTNNNNGGSSSSGNSVKTNDPLKAATSISSSPTQSLSPSAVAAASPSVTITWNGKDLIYPALDTSPDVNDPIVKNWLSELNLQYVPKNLPLSNNGVPNWNQAQCRPPTKIVPNQGSWTCQKILRPDDKFQCPKKGVWGLTYDDGPSESTPSLLNALNSNNLKATFFVVGSRVISYPQTLKAAYDKGHNIAVHTWSHPALTSLSNEAIVAELKWTLKAIKDIIGVTPVYMRPPFGDTDDRVRALTRAVGLWTVVWTEGFDTDDWSLRPGQKSANAQHVIDIFQGWLDKLPSLAAGFIVLEHDLFPQTVAAAISVLKVATKKSGLIIQTVPQCLGDNTPYLEQGGKVPSLIVANVTIPSPKSINSNSESTDDSEDPSDSSIKSSLTSNTISGKIPIMNNIWILAVVGLMVPVINSVFSQYV
ncbi:hypothetical protein G9A89_010559 [Geosiphon pyriformis]|nr:hypothetical protein G9A89_010559 [Geosiphon pyriformis]